MKLQYWQVPESRLVFTYRLESRIPIPPEKPASRKVGGGGRRDGSKSLGRIVGFPESDPQQERAADFAPQDWSCSAHPGPEDSGRRWDGERLSGSRGSGSLSWKGVY